MSSIQPALKVYQDQIEHALWSQEVSGRLEEALAVYRDAEDGLLAFNVADDAAAFQEQQRVLAYCLMRQGNILRQLGNAREALTLGDREIAAARASGSDIELARSLMSHGASHIAVGEIERGSELVEEARGLFLGGDSNDHRQGLGWYWVLQADLANAGLMEGGPAAVIEAADRALEILCQIENWAGVARALAARAQAHERLGDATAAAADRQAQKLYQGRMGAVETSAA
jgi:tetratricopeptide (TPR) repeat protein